MKHNIAMQAKEIRSVYLCGLGAVGSSYANKFYAMRPDCLKVVVDRERAERYTANGVIVNGSPIPFEYLQPEQHAPAADLILLAVKRHHLQQAIADIRNFVGKHTILLSLLNGIDSEGVIGEAFGMDKVLYSFVIETDTVRESTSIRFSKLGTIVFGERTNATHSPRVAAVEQLFHRAGIPCRIPENMIRELWWKFMMNVGINQTSAVLRAPYGVFQKVEAACEVMKMACMEAVRLSAKAGVDLTEKDVDDCLKIVRRLSPEGKTSMLQDVEAHRKTEVESFAGTVIDLGRKYGIATPANDMFYRMIRTLEATYPDDARVTGMA